MNDENTATIMVVLVIGFILFLSYLGCAAQCSSKAQFQGLQYDYGIMTGCMVKVDGKWMDYERLRYTND